MIEIRDSIIEDVYKLLPNIQKEDLLEAERMGVDIKECLLKALSLSIYKKTAIIDDEIVAMWGVCGNLFAIDGLVYLTTSKKITQVSPIKVARIYINEVNNMKTLFPSLYNYVDAKYKKAIHLLHLSGFSVSRIVHLGPNNETFLVFSLEGNNQWV